MKKETEQKVDIDYADRVVPEEGKKGFVTMFMIMLGFTFFSASMWAGQQLAAGLDFWGFLTDRLVRCWYRHVCDSGSRRIIR